jgi:hypothetical protein
MSSVICYDSNSLLSRAMKIIFVVAALLFVGTFGSEVQVLEAMEGRSSSVEFICHLTRQLIVTFL